MTPPFEIHRPRTPAVLLYDSPHSGRYYPPDFRLGAPLAEIRKGEDAYVDELLLPAVAEGAALLVNNYPRCYIDVNRAVTDIDPSQLGDVWPGALAPTEKSRRGLGLIRRYVTPGVEAQAAPLTAAEVQRRIETVYVPYHAALDALVAELRTAAPVLHIDWHSMKSVGNEMTPDGAGAKRADFVVSDGRGTTADADLTATIVDALRERGYSVTVNDPYTGGTIVKRIGDPDGGIHSIQVEINRRLYLDESTVTKTPGTEVLAESLRELTAHLTSVVRRRFGR